MWVQKRGKSFRAYERLKDYSTGRTKIFSVAINAPTPEEKKLALQLLNEQSDATKPVDINTMTFEQLIEEYRKDQRLSVSAGTYKRNHGTCERFMKFFGRKTRVTDFNAQFVRSRLLSLDKSAGALNEYLVRLKALFNWAYRNDYIQDVSWLNKLTYFEDKVRREKLQDKFLEKEELQILLNAIRDTKWKFVAQFMVMTGMRFGEVSALRMENIDLKERYIHVVENWNSVVHELSNPKTQNSNRDVYIQDELLDLIHHIIDFNKHRDYDTDLLFCMESGSHIELTSFNKYISENNPLPKRVTSHVFRHTHTSLMAEAGVPIEVISRRLGHTDSKLTRTIYFHVTNKIKKADEDKVREIKIC